MEISHSYGEGGRKPVVTVNVIEGGRKIGKTDVYINDRGQHEAHPEVDKHFRRRGVATAMYRYIEGQLGIELHPARVQNKAGKAIWRKKRFRKQVFTMSSEDIRGKLRSQGCGCKKIDASLAKAEKAHAKAENKLLMLKAKAEAHKLSLEAKAMRAQEKKEKARPFKASSFGTRFDDPDNRFYVIGRVGDEAWIFAGRKYEVDAETQEEEARGRGISTKIVTRSVLLDNGIDPRDDDSWTPPQNVSVK